MNIQSKLNKERMLKMIKCKLAQVDGNCPKGKEICCHECEDFETCSSACGEEDSANCEDAIFEGSTELEVFQSKAAATIQAISNLVTTKKELEEKEKVMKEQLQKAMEEHGIKSFDNDVIKVTYMVASVRNSVDSAKLKKNYPDIAAECNKSSNVKAFVKIEVK